MKDIAGEVQLQDNKAKASHFLLLEKLRAKCSGRKHGGVQHIKEKVFNLETVFCGMC
jgi:hypothetical protein